jgi:hypothetical protein
VKDEAYVLKYSRCEQAGMICVALSALCMYNAAFYRSETERLVETCQSFSFTDVSSVSRYALNLFLSVLQKAFLFPKLRLL